MHERNMILPVLLGARDGGTTNVVIVLVAIL